MRLSQLARKLALRPSEVVTFLSAYQITLEEGLHARLTEEQVEKVVRHFAPDRLHELKGEPQEEPQPEVKEEPVAVKEEEPEIIAPVVAAIVASEVPEEKAEVIKAPKVELAGLKVLGKIELPEARKKTGEQPSETTDTPQQSERPRREERRKRPDRDRQQHAPRTHKNPVTLQREQEQQEAEEKRKEKARREKEKKAEYYYSRVRSGAPTKAMRYMEEPLEEIKEQKPAPKGFWGRFVSWWNGK